MVTSVPIVAAVPERPGKTSPEVKKAAAIDLSDDLNRWMDHPLTTRSIEDLTRMHWPSNGYEFAKDLERKWGISPDFELVEILEGAWSTLDYAKNEAVKAWVTEHNIVLQHPVGTRASVKTLGAGHISGHDTAHAIYLFIPDNEADKYKNGGGYHVTPEKIEEPRIVPGGET